MPGGIMSSIDWPAALVVTVCGLAVAAAPGAPIAGGGATAPPDIPGAAIVPAPGAPGVAAVAVGCAPGSGTAVVGTAVGGVTGKGAGADAGVGWFVSPLYNRSSSRRVIASRFVPPSPVAF